MIDNENYTLMLSQRSELDNGGALEVYENKHEEFAQTLMTFASRHEGELREIIDQVFLERAEESARPIVAAEMITNITAENLIDPVERLMVEAFENEEYQLFTYFFDIWIGMMSVHSMLLLALKEHELGEALSHEEMAIALQALPTAMSGDESEEQDILFWHNLIHGYSESLSGDSTGKSIVRDHIALIQTFSLGSPYFMQLPFINAKVALSGTEIYQAFYESVSDIHHAVLYDE